MLTNSRCCQGTIRCETNRTSLTPKAELLRSPKKALGHQLVYLFMCRFTCSRCWKTALALAEHGDLFEASDTMVVMVGDWPHIKAATRLACELQLPYALVADSHGAMRRSFSLEQAGSGGHDQAFVLVDRNRTVRYRQGVSSPGGRLQLASLLSVVQSTAVSTVSSRRGGIRQRAE
jgi:peroxiredoxin